MEISSYYNLSLNFINTLEGYKTKFKNLHWSAPHLTYHKEIDELLEELIEYQDIIAETSQGYMGKQYPVNSIVPKILSFETALQALISLNSDVSNFHIQIKKDDSLAGVVNATNDFQQELLKTLYLFRLAIKDGYKEGEEKNTKALM